MEYEEWEPTTVTLQQSRSVIFLAYGSEARSICKLTLYICRLSGYIGGMIKSFANKQLRALWETSKSKIDKRMHGRILRRLDVLDAATAPEDMNLPGFDFHALRGHNPIRYTVHVNGPWCITFEFRDGDAHVLDYEQYH